MTTIVMNTKTGAVTEHDHPLAQVTANFGASLSGLFSMGGNTDGGNSINASIATPRAIQKDSTQRNLVSDAYLAMDGAGRGVFTVIGKSVQWPYPFTVMATGVSRVPLGRGIRENNLGFKYQNAGGADFSIDRIEVRSYKAQRRV